jgi:hypothetical protein
MASQPGGVISDGLESASATRLSVPEMCRMSAVILPGKTAASAASQTKVPTHGAGHGLEVYDLSKW